MKILVTITVSDPQTPQISLVRSSFRIDSPDELAAIFGARSASEQMIGDAVDEFVNIRENALERQRKQRLVANLTRTPEAIHDAVAEEGSD